MLVIAHVWFLTGKILSDKGQVVNVYVNNNLMDSFKLNKDGIYDICDMSGTKIMTLDISDNKAGVTYATCPDHLCMHQKKISQSNETIVCLPNKTVIEISSENPDSTKEYDAITY